MVKDDVASFRPFATPYALSIYGQPILPSPDPYRRGTAYGDGRALSYGDVEVPAMEAAAAAAVAAAADSVSLVG